MKYTNSQDGIERCTINIQLRLTKEDYKEFATVAKRNGYKSVSDYVNSQRIYEFLCCQLETSRWLEDRARL